MRTNLLLIAVMLLFTSIASAELGQPYRVLLPIYLEEPVPGAFGSLWKTQWVVRNPTSSDFTIERCGLFTMPPYEGPCPRDFDASAHLAPGDVETTLPRFQGEFHVLNERGGPRLLYIRTDVSNSASASELTFNLRAVDSSRAKTDAGLEIPVVRQEQFRTSTISLLNVPTDGAFRHTFRLYETNLTDATFTVRLFDQATNQLLGESDYHLSFSFPQRFATMFEPPYLQIDGILGLVPLPRISPPLPSLVRVEIEPRTAGSQFWAFMTITSNETQHVTLVTPQ